MDWTVAGMLEDGENGCSCASHEAQCALHCRVSKGGLLPPHSSQSKPTSAWLATVSLLLVKSSSLELTRQGNRLSNAGSCLSGRKPCLSQGGKIEELLVAYRPFWDTALLSCLCLSLKWATKPNHPASTQRCKHRSPGKAGQVQFRINGFECIHLCCCSAGHPLQTKKRSAQSSVVMQVMPQ